MYKFVDVVEVEIKCYIFIVNARLREWIKLTFGAYRSYQSPKNCQFFFFFFFTGDFFATFNYALTENSHWRKKFTVHFVLLIYIQQGSFFFIKNDMDFLVCITQDKSHSTAKNLLPFFIRFFFVFFFVFIFYYSIIISLMEYLL